MTDETSSPLIVSFIHSAAFGGPHNQLQYLASQQSRYRFVAVLPAEPGDAADRLRRSGIEVLEVPMRRLTPRGVRRPLSMVASYARQVATFCRILRSYRPAIVETHGLLNLDAVIASRICRIALVWQIVDTRPPRLLQFAIGSFARIIASCTMTTGLQVARHHNLISERNFVFFPPVANQSDTDPNFSAEQRRTHARSILKCTPGRLQILCIGNFNPQKRHLFLMNALTTLGLDESVPPFDVHLIGSAQAGHEEYFRRVSKAAEHSQQQVHIHQGLSTPGSELIYAADVLVVCSGKRSEGVPTVILEAMAAGVCVLTTPCGAVSEVVLNHVSGIISANSDDVARFAEDLSMLLKDDSSRSEMAAAGLRRYGTKFGSERFVAVSDRAFGFCLRGQT